LPEASVEALPEAQVEALPEAQAEAPAQRLVPLPGPRSVSTAWRIVVAALVLIRHYDNIRRWARRRGV